MVSFNDVQQFKNLFNLIWFNFLKIKYIFIVSYEVGEVYTMVFLHIILVKKIWDIGLIFRVKKNLNPNLLGFEASFDGHKRF
jgi:hypothetical protein